MTFSKPKRLAAGAAFAALAFGLWYNYPAEKDAVEGATTPLATTDDGEPTIITSQASEPETSNKPELTEAEREAMFINDIRERFSPNIHIKHAQIRFIEQMISYLKAHHPEDWQQRMYALLQASFPDMADALMAKYESLQSYNEWLVADRQALQKMTREERRAVLWDKRYAAFGTEAEEIWAAEIKNQKIQDALGEVAAGNTEGSLVEQAESVVAAIRETYGEQSDDFIRRRQTELVNKFLAIPSIQENLHQLPEEDRRKSMREVRATMGMDTAALDRWENLDKKRDEVWSLGSSYMDERERILAQYEGNKESSELYALQKQVFGDEAEQIRLEEASGFYRYDRQRRLGRE